MSGPVTKTIENPEVPGLECLLPPRPPPLPGSLSSTEASVVTTQIKLPQQTEENASATTGTVLAPSQFPTAATSPYYIHPPMQTQSSPTPWWVPTEADSSELYDSQYAQWYEATYKVPLPANLSGKAKSKYYKRKSEFIDPAQDAEKVASAQRELSALMKPLKCDLCNAVMNSTLQAKLHYDGKPHQKKVSMFLNQSVKKLKTEDSGQVSSTTEADWNTYCEICKTWFTSQTDATQHYAGKKHLRAANGGPRVRTSKKQNLNQAPIDPSGRFGIGIGFQAEPPAPVIIPAEAAIVVPVVSPVPIPTIAAAVPVSTPLYTAPSYQTLLRCDLCGVSANRKDQLETHRRGARHLRMLRMNGLPVPDTVPEAEVVPVVSGPLDYSIYRTPSGQYYCAPCNVSLNSESSFAQHVESKKHKNQLNPKSPSTAANTAKKTRFKKK
ncbi:zinc finger protein 346 [Neodiprion lecontei]|uniref:Zinc finger protein 346 n=1 Tax=Neodiprion lecontei TaxID=441921 RepID=A0A6J0BCI8_NEOLC|nr:zinc finger protein 346 [Neodiprion lecontei]